MKALITGGTSGIGKEIANILDEKGKPKETYEVTAINNPWIRKGELVKVGAGDMNFRYIVTSITHNAVNRQMNIDFELADESKL